MTRPFSVSTPRRTATRSALRPFAIEAEPGAGRVVLRGMLATGGSPLVVDEATVVEAETLGRRATGIDLDATGTAGLAGLLEWSRRPDAARGERVGLLFTGARR